QAQRDWLDLLQGRAHNVHEVDVCALSLLCKSPRAQAAGAARLAGFTVRAGGTAGTIFQILGKSGRISPW
ncbi:MAG: hypothetical protein MR959_05370, partial [Selenomonas bovis]|nr:hypothetical protein [Selenomonas bovis]